MNGPSGRGWWMGALGLFAALLVLWVAAAVRLSAAAAAPSDLMTSLRSRLTANYAPDPGGSTVRSLRLTIFQEVLQDLGMSNEAAAGHSQEMAEQMKSPVPTATARDFQGAKPFTATPTATPVPTETPLPTATNTPKPRPTRTKTPVPTVRVVAPTDTPVGGVDTTDPNICCIALNPAPTGSLDVCTIDVIDLEVEDLAFSSGMDLGEIYIKYEKAGMGNWQTTNLSMTSGGFVAGPGSDWRGHFAGSFTIHGRVAGDSINVAGKVEDNVGRNDHKSAGSYTLTVNCP
jgi:hypothetical protein